MRHLAALALVAASIGAGTSDAAAKVTLSERTIPYTVGGRTGKEIYAQIGKRGPLLSGQRDNKVATSAFTFDIRNVKGGVQGNRCVIGDVDVHVSVTYRVPAWNGKGGANVRKAWEAFLSHIWRHEKRHTEIAMDYARRLERDIRALKGDARRACAGMAEMAQERAKRSRIWHDRKQQAFDANWFGDGGLQFKYDKALVAAE
jgi:predicted secreted Zn-dependent protease